KRQHVGRGADSAALVDQGDAGRVGEPRHVAGGGRRADADEADIVIAERPGGGDGHHLVGGEISHSASSVVVATPLPSSPARGEVPHCDRGGMVPYTR